MPELLFLLLPVAALYGYVMGRNSIRQAQLHQHEKINQDFLSGLNLFLNNQRDKAIEVLIENLEINNETFTTHVALGKLFRAKGENDRAIKIHQFLAKQDSLSPAQRKLSILQLGKDYVECALYDRAENLLTQLIDDDELGYEARVILSRIYQTYREWQSAYDILRGVEPKDGDNLDNIRAYLLCEIASKDSGHSRTELLKKALAYDLSCARAYLLLIEDALAANDVVFAQEQARLLAKYAFKFVSSLVDKLESIFPDLQQRLDFLIDISSYGHSTAIASQISQIKAACNEPTQARKGLVASLEQHATIRGFASLMDLNAQQVESEQARLMMKSLRNMVITKIEQLPDYECDQCGYQGSYLFWQCPRCKNWGSVKPITGLTGD